MVICDNIKVCSKVSKIASKTTLLSPSCGLIAVHNVHIHLVMRLAVDLHFHCKRYVPIAVLNLDNFSLLSLHIYEKANKDCRLFK